MKKYKAHSKLSDKLKAYSTLTAVAVASSANAAIQYTDVNPDSTFSTNGDFYDLDLNNDNIVDFQINLTNIQSSYNGIYIDAKGVAIYPFSINAVSASSNSYFYYPYALSPNQVIGPSGNFIGSTAMALGAETYFIYGSSTYNANRGNFLGQSDKYLGLKIQLGSNTHYGWARVDVSANGDSFTIKDYAFEDTPNTPILTGQTVGIQHQDLSKLINAKVFDKSLKLSTSSTELAGNEINIVDIKGVSVHSSILGSNEEIIDLSQFSAGMYIVDIRTTEGIFRKKIMLEN